jgi:hypothetical protein
MTEPKRHESRRSSDGRTFVVLGDAGDGRAPGDGFHYVEAHTYLIETTRRRAGAKFAVPTARVAEWEVITP